MLEPIAEQLRQEVLASPVVHRDDTPVTLAMPQGSQGGSRQARVFKDFTGYLQADAYSGYDQLVTVRSCPS